MPAWLKDRVKNHLSLWILCKRLLECISPPPNSPSNACFVPWWVAKAPGLHKAFPVWVPHHCHQHLGSQDATEISTVCKGTFCGGLGCLACACIREKLHDALGTCQGSLPPLLACVTEPVSDAILCLFAVAAGTAW